MCGISGFIQTKVMNTESEIINIINKMNISLAHRGPDDTGTWIDQGEGIALGHRRLSVIDLSQEGRQPMVSHSGRYVITYNGEIYNFIEIRKQLEKKGYCFRGYSDTEVILSAFDEWGLERAVKKFVGMFAFALWDKKLQQLSLVRDRLGEKPLYYGWMGNTFLFASELKAFHVYPGFKKEIDRNSLALYLRYCYIPAPYSIYQGINKLLPGCILTISADNPGFSPQPIHYWSTREIAEKGINESFNKRETDALDELEDIILNTVRCQMISDVPLGAFLSGGVDSSLIVALMQKHTDKPVKTFTIGTYEDAYNEAKHAKAVADYLGTEHTELYVSADEAMQVIPKLPILYDEPYGDSSQIPTFLVANLTKQKVTVSLSGDGGDELFGGYNRYYWGAKVWQNTKSTPYFLRKIASSSLTCLSPNIWDRIFSVLSSALPKSFNQRLPGNKIYKLADALVSQSQYSMYHSFVSTWKDPVSGIIGAYEPSTIFTDRDRRPNFDDFIHNMMYIDLNTYLIDDIMVKVDRACMGVSLESRTPFLDHRLVEFAWRLPLSMKIQNGKGKWLLRQLLYKYIPKELIERPKMGFGIPIESWLRGPLKEWAEELLGEKRLEDEGFFKVDIIRKMWKEHLLGKRDWQYQLWNVLMFQLWYKQWKMIK